MELDLFNILSIMKVLNNRHAFAPAYCGHYTVNAGRKSVPDSRLIGRCCIAGAIYPPAISGVMYNLLMSGSLYYIFRSGVGLSCLNFRVAY
ncbi:MAG: hypothetical protein HC880_09150 [Bacteroidia bacterium]|nr:hypothetical protein [Bacteroidia bacterium]